MIQNYYKLRKGLNINLKGKAVKKTIQTHLEDEVALVPEDFYGMTPKVVVKEGDDVKAGDALFVDKKFPQIKFASPVSGKVTEVLRGDRRKLLYVKVAPDKVQQYHDFGAADPAKLDSQQVIGKLLEAGLFGYINQLPYAVTAAPDICPKAIFVSAFRDMPLAADFSFELEDNQEAFKAGISALSQISHTYIGVNKQQSEQFDSDFGKNVTVNVFDGPCPAGNVGVQVNHVDAVNKGEVVWTVDPTAVIFFGRLFTEGRVRLTRKIAIAGSEIKEPCYAEVFVGQPIKPLLENNINNPEKARIILGNPLTGKKSTINAFVGAHTSEITVIPEGDDRDELLGWIMPRTNDFSTNRSYFSWLLGKSKEYVLDARIKGGERHMIMSGEYDRVMPMDIYPEYLIKAIITGNIDKMEQLGIYEVAPEDFALAEFVDSSKLELQKIVREGLDMLRKENA